jgi:hypothetical protein
MAISDNIKAKAKQVKDEVAAGGVSPTAQDLQKKATKAICGGIDEWVIYMKMFADANNPAQLARLIPTDGTTDDVHEVARAYLVRNGMCTETTTGQLLDNVDLKLDTP